MHNNSSKKTKEEIFEETVGNRPRPLKSARICCLCPLSATDKNIIDIGELVINIGKRVAHIKHFKLAVIGVK